MWFRRSAVFYLAAAIAAGVCAAQTSNPQRWVGTWSAAPMAAEGGYAFRPFSGVTLREIAHISAGGAQIRIRFTNEFGTDPLTIRDAHVALSAGGSKVQASTDHALTFGGAAIVRIPAGAIMYSDPVDLKVAPLADVAVSFFLPSQVMRSETIHFGAMRDNFIANGDVARAVDLTQPTTITSWYFFDGIDASGAGDSRAVVTLGDSITDGAHSAHNANHRWPNYLAARLQQDPSLQHVSVLNMGIGGNRVLNDNYGPNALSRIDRDVLAQNGVKYVIVLEGINDIGSLKRLANQEWAMDFIVDGFSYLRLAKLPFARASVPRTTYSKRGNAACGTR